MKLDKIYGILLCWALFGLRISFFFTDVISTICLINIERRKEKARGKREKLRNWELHNLCSS
jgi:hypothetical protein